MHMPIALVLAATLSSAALAQDPRRDPTELLVQRLADPDAGRAEAAARDLIRGGSAVLEPLRAALSASADPAFAARAERVLAMCEVAGPEVDGLKIGITCDAAELDRGTEATLTTTVCNLTDREIVLWTGMSYAGNTFETGAAVCRLVDRDGELVAQPSAYGVGFCGTGAYPLTIRIAPWSYQRFETRVVYYSGAEGEEQEPFPLGAVGPHLRLGEFVHLSIEQQDSVRLRVEFKGQLLDEDATWWQMPKAMPDWSGTVRSNEIDVVLRG